tara:strand:- start:306 stop:1061 length:756 start_codon:yes stop_codon:yes gene_type:complete
MGYLRELPNVRYQSPLAHKNSSKDFIVVKNLFRKNKLLDWLSVSGASTFNKFVVADGARPDNVAEDIYGSPELDYVVIISCGITNLRDEWPLSSKELNEYVENKYGLAGMGEIHHYETLEVRDENNRLILPAGQIVDSTFTIDGPSTKYNGLGVTWSGNNPSTIGTLNPEKNIYESSSSSTYVGDTISPITGVSNYDYETQKNEQKREIRPLKSQYLQMFISDFKRIMRYDRNSQYITDKLITTDNTDIVT